MTIEDIKKIIDKEAEVHRTADEEDVFEWEAAELRVHQEIIQYCIDNNIRLKGYNLEQTLDLDDEDSIDHIDSITRRECMDNLTGFIVEVKPKTGTPTLYHYDAESRMLHPNDTFVGYFWQMTDRQADGTFKKAHIHEARLVDAKRNLFTYGGKAVFLADEISITIRALHAPDSNNRHLPQEFKKYETWNPLSLLQNSLLCHSRIV